MRFTRLVQVANGLVNRKSKIVNSNGHVFGPNFQAFILVLPNHGGVGVQKLRREFATGEGQQLFRLLGGVFIGVIVIARAFALAIIPMRDGVNGFVLLRPGGERFAQFGGNFIEGH